MGGRGWGGGGWGEGRLCLVERERERERESASSCARVDTTLPRPTSRTPCVVAVFGFSRAQRLFIQSDTRHTQFAARRAAWIVSPSVDQARVEAETAVDGGSQC